jgi:hypothetical protein
MIEIVGEERGVGDSMSSPTVTKHHKSGKHPSGKKKKERKYSIYSKIEVD